MVIPQRSHFTFHACQTRRPATVARREEISMSMPSVSSGAVVALIVALTLCPAYPSQAQTSRKPNFSLKPMSGCRRADENTVTANAR